MAEKVQSVKRKSVYEKAVKKRKADSNRAKTRVSIGEEAFERWRALKDRKSLQTDAMVALFLLDSYEKEEYMSTPIKHGVARPPPPALSTIVPECVSARGDDFSVAGVEELETRDQYEAVVEQLDASMSSLDLNIESNIPEDIETEFNDIQNSIIDWDDETWHPSMEAASVSSLEEEMTKEVDSSEDSNDETYVPRIRLRHGGALNTDICLEALPTVSLDEAVHSSVENASKDIPPLPDVSRVVVEEDVIGRPASIAYHNCLKQLADYLLLPITMCTAVDSQTNAQCQARRPFEVTVKARGTAAIIEWMCPRGHVVWRWSTQPIFKYGMLVGDFMLATNILLSGNNYAKVALLFKFMNMGMVDRTSFFGIQDCYCIDSIKEYWNEKRTEILSKIRSKGPVVVLGDARMDSPGFCAQFCTYTAMDNATKHIVSLVNLDKRETHRNSVAMEKESFMRTLESLRQELQVTEVCTDAHAQISALFSKGIYKDSGIQHSFDMWHGSKNLSKRIVAEGQRKATAILLMWNRDICAHFWYCCKTARSYEEFFDMWVGLLHHVTGEHEWALGACHHGPLTDDREKDWIQKGSVAHQKLREIVLNERWLKTIHKYLPFRSTAELESFHNHILMYASKRFSFSPQGYAARIMLAALDYNYHLSRPAKRKKDGSIQYGKNYNKRSRTWTLITIKVPKDYGYIPDLQTAILRRKLSAPGGMAKHRPTRPEDPRRLGVLSGVPAPTVQELLQRQVSRGLAHPPSED